MSRLRRTVVPFRWSSVALTFTQGTASSVSMSAFLTNPQGRTITYSVIGSLPAGVTHNAGTVSYNGTSPIATGSVQFRASSGGFVAESSPAPVVIQASVSNTAPIWQGTTPASLGNFVEGVGGTYNLAQHAFDAEGDPIRYYRTGSAADTAPGTFVVNETTGVLTVPSGPSGAYSLEIALAPFVGQVTGLAASPTSYTVALSWVAATLATGYRIERSPDGTAWTEIGTSVTPGYTDTNLTPATVYRYRVRATDGTNFGSYSATVTATTTALPSIGTYQPALAVESQPEPYQVWDDGVTSPNYQSFNGDLYLRWATEGGSWTDLNGTSQGTVPYTSVAIPTAGAYYAFDVATLVQRAINTGLNKGFFLQTSGTSASVTLDGRLNANPPTLEVVTSAGTFQCPVTALARWARSSTTTALPRDSRQTALISSAYYGIARFNLNGVTGTVQSATMRLYASARAGTNTALRVFEADPPAFQAGLKTGDTPVPGLAASFPGDNFGSDARVLKAGDFTGATQTSVSGSASTWSVPKLWDFDARNAVSIVPDPDAPGTSYWRGEFVPVQTGTDPRREALSASYTVMFPDRNEPGYPIDMATYRDDLYYRMYVMLEDDFTSTLEANKMGLSWDLRFGYWIPTSTAPNFGYWQNVGGNGGTPGDGTHTYPFTDSRVTDAHIYRGNYQRMEGGVFLADGPYTEFRPWLGYNYQIDTPLYPPMRSYSDIVDMKFRRGRWYCIEQRCRMNTIDLSSPDAYGNGVANADGLLETWVNGVKISSQADYKWRRHPAMGIKGVNTNWYLGGQAVHPTDAANMHFRISHVVLATQYIGPRVRP